MPEPEEKPIPVRRKRDGKVGTVPTREGLEKMIASGLYEAVNEEDAPPKIADPAPPDEGRDMERELSNSPRLRQFSKGLAAIPGSSSAIAALGHQAAALMHPYPVATERGIDAPAEEPGVTYVQNPLRALFLASPPVIPMMSAPGSMEAAVQNQREVANIEPSAPIAAERGISAPVTGRLDQSSLTGALAEGAGNMVAMAAPVGAAAKGGMGLLSRVPGMPALGAMLGGDALASGMAGALMSLNNEPIDQELTPENLGEAGMRALESGVSDALMAPVVDLGLLPFGALAGRVNQYVRDGKQGELVRAVEQGGGRTAMTGRGGVKGPPEHERVAEAAYKRHRKALREKDVTEIAPPSDEIVHATAEPAIRQVRKDEVSTRRAHQSENDAYHKTPEGLQPQDTTVLLERVREELKRRKREGGEEALPFVETAELEKLYKRLTGKPPKEFDADLAQAREDLAALERADESLVSEEYLAELRDKVTGIEAMRDLDSDKAVPMNARELDVALEELDQKLSWDSARGKKDRAMASLAEAMRQVRDQFTMDGKPGGWSALKQRHHNEMVDIANAKHSLGLSPNAALPDKGSQIPKQQLDAVRQKLAGWMGDKDLLRMANRHPELKDILKDARASRATDALRGHDVHVGTSSGGAYGSLQGGSLGRRIDPVFNFFVKLGEGPTAAGIRASAGATAGESMEMQQQEFDLDWLRQLIEADERREREQ